MRINKTATAEYHRNWYSKNKTIRRKQIDAWKQKRIAEWATFKSTLCCVVCGESEACCLDFHHKDPNTKDAEVSRMARTHGVYKLQQELLKCVVLCSNCHRKVHAGLIQLVE